jgi:hypothetical protein
LEKEMKKYFTIAALLGAIAFASVSFLAQADEKFDAAGNVAVKESAAVAATPAGAPAADAPAAEGDAGVAAEAVAAPSDAAEDDEECAVAASSKNSAEETDAAYKKCMAEKGHTDEGSSAANAGDAGAEE